MVTNEALVAEFKFMGIEKLSDDILNKCIEIVCEQEIDAERFVEEWIAFAQTNLGGNLQPTLIALDTMVRKQFHVKQENINTKSEPVQTHTSKIKVYSNNGSTDMKNILNAYNAGTPTKKDQSTKKDELEELSFSPASLNPNVTKPSAVYAERTDRGSVLETFGLTNLLEQDAQVSAKISQHVSITLLGKYDVWNTASGRYMFETPEFEATAINDRIDQLGQILINKYGNDNNRLCLTYGRIRCDGDGRLNAQSILLEKSSQQGKGEAKIINLQNIPKFSLFPGQIVLLEGNVQTNAIRQNILMAQKLFTNATPELPLEMPKISGGPLNIIVASGPYTLCDNLAYQPLQDLIKYVLTNQPHVLIIIGPFVDMRHSSVIDGTMATTYRSHFQNLMEQVVTPLKDTNVQVIVVPSTLDAHHHSVYPTPPFEPLSKQKFSNHYIHMTSDPCLININGVVIGVTSADVLFHLAKTELNCSPSNPDRMARFAEHVLTQRCFYPIYPTQQSAPGQNRLCVDQQLLNIHGILDVAPHIMILPSNLKQFIRNVNGSIVINPERLSKGFVGGTFASINIYPEQTKLSLAENITCRIIKI